MSVVVAPHDDGRAERVLEELEDQIVAMARAMARGDQVLAEDLAQEARVGALEAARAWWPEGGVRLLPWCMTRARQRAIDAVRREIRPLPVPCEELPELGDEHAAERRLEAALTLEAVARRLRPRERVALVDLGHLSTREAEAAAGWPAGRCHRARRRGRRRLSTLAEEL